MKPGHTVHVTYFHSSHFFSPAVSNISTKNICSFNTELPEWLSAGPLPSLHIKVDDDIGDSPVYCISAFVAEKVLRGLDLSGLTRTLPITTGKDEFSTALIRINFNAE